MAFWDSNKNYKPWDWDPDRDDPDKNGRNEEFRESEEDKLFEQNKSEFEWNELESKITPEFIANGLKKNNDRIKNQYQEYTTGPGQNLMLLQLTGWKFGAKNELAINMRSAHRSQLGSESTFHLSHHHPTFHFSLLHFSLLPDRPPATPDSDTRQSGSAPS